MTSALDLANIQGTVLRGRPLPYFGAYLFLSIEDTDQAKEVIRRLIPHLTSAADWERPVQDAWINVTFTFEGLRRMGVAEDILAGFPPEFREGMAKRKDYLGDTGDSDPSKWDMPHGGSGLHIGMIVFAGSEALRDSKIAIGHKALENITGVRLIGRLDIGVPPTMREHFGYNDGISRPYIEGMGGDPAPGWGEPAKAGEFLLGYENELGHIATGPGPEQFWRNGTYIAVRKLRQDVMAFRNYIKAAADTEDGQEFVAAKLMGRWRSGCPLALSPDTDDKDLAHDRSRNNSFGYYDDDHSGRKTPLGSHIRRVNPRDGLKDTVVDYKLHRLIRRGAAYGPALPEDATEDDGRDRGVVIAMINANPGRQFEFVQSQWVNDGDFISEGARTDPIIGNRETADDFVYPVKPVRQHLTGLPKFVSVRGGEHVFLPGMNGLQWLVRDNSGSSCSPERNAQYSPLKPK